MKKMIIKTIKKTLSFNQSVKVSVLVAILALAGCKASDRGELVGVGGRGLWFHPAPLGMVYIPSGTIHTGASTQDGFNSYLMPNKQITVTAFWMDETEITLNSNNPSEVLATISWQPIDGYNYCIFIRKLGSDYFPVPAPQGGHDESAFYSLITDSQIDLKRRCA